ncbi:hypothetical protein [Robertmurraya sp. FSL R5-0851]
MLKKMKKRRRQLTSIALATGIALSGLSFQTAYLLQSKELRRRNK